MSRLAIRHSSNSVALMILRLQGLCDAAQPPIEIATDKAVEPGATLSVLWGRPQPRKRIANGVSVVILQGLLEISCPLSFNQSPMHYR